MQVSAKVAMEVSLKDLAAALADSPEDFAAFWFSFAEIVKKNKIDLEPFGVEMAPQNGSIRQHPFSAIYDAMKHHERVEARNKGAGY